MNDLISREYLLSLASAEGAYEYVSAEEIAKAPTVPAILIPENATNGDVLKRLLYGKAIITEFIHDVNISVNNNVIGQFDMEWWRSPYKRGETE
jgi:hypothetical protein